MFRIASGNVKLAIAVMLSPLIMTAILAFPVNADTLKNDLPALVFRDQDSILAHPELPFGAVLLLPGKVQPGPKVSWVVPMRTKLPLTSKLEMLRLLLMPSPRGPQPAVPLAVLPTDRVEGARIKPSERDIRLPLPLWASLI